MPEMPKGWEAKGALSKINNLADAGNDRDMGKADRNVENQPV